MFIIECHAGYVVVHSCECEVLEDSVMREAFERWAVVEGLPVNKGSKKEYLNVKTRLAWRAWKAGVLSVANPR